MLSPYRVRRIYVPLHPVGVDTGSTNAVRRTVSRDILQHALLKANINLDPLSYSPAGLCSLSPTPPPAPTPTVRPAEIGVPARPRRPNPNPTIPWTPPSPSQLRTLGRATPWRRGHGCGHRRTTTTSRGGRERREWVPTPFTFLSSPSSSPMNHDDMQQQLISVIQRL